VESLVSVKDIERKLANVIMREGNRNGYFIPEKINF
jgi:hypothetical protein